ncbi:hypothetical protein Tco_1302979 [Tanacetum coccineum]
MRKQTLLDLFLGVNPHVEFSTLLVLGGFQLERYSPLAQPRLTVNPQMVQMKISLTDMNANKLLMSVHVLLTSVQEFKSDEQEQWRLQTTLQAPLLKEKKGVHGQELVRYSVSNVLDTAYWRFLGRIDHVSFVVFGECRHRYAVSSLMDMAYWLSEH